MIKYKLEVKESNDCSEETLYQIMIDGLVYDRYLSKEKAEAEYNNIVGAINMGKALNKFMENLSRVSSQEHIDEFKRFFDLNTFKEVL